MHINFSFDLTLSFVISSTYFLWWLFIFPINMASLKRSPRKVFFILYNLYIHFCWQNFHHKFILIWIHSITEFILKANKSRLLTYVIHFIQMYCFNIFLWHVYFFFVLLSNVFVTVAILFHLHHYFYQIYHHRNYHHHHRRIHLTSMVVRLLYT